MAKEPEEKESIIYKDVVFKGDLKFKDSLTILGRIEGSVIGENGNVFLEERGIVHGELKTLSLKNHGVLEGKATINDYSLYASGHHNADVSVEQIMIEKGATINGKITMDNLS